jgi:elongation factor Ts
MEISATLVKELREKTGAGMMDCKKALSEAGGDFEKATEFLRKKGLAAAAKRSARAATEGLVHAYIHGEGRIGVLVEINCETDFVARNEEFKGFVRDVAMHIAAAAPLYVRPEEVPAQAIEKEKEIFKGQLAQDPKNANKPPQVIEKILEGKVQKYLDDICLLNQAFVKNPDVTVGALTTEMIAKIGENISIRRFARFNLGEGLEKRAE